MPPAPEGDTLLEGFARQLAAADVGVWRSTGVYRSTETGIVLGGLPQDPDAVIVLASYGVSDDPTLSDTVTGVQVTVRAGGLDPRPADGLTGRVFDALHGLHDLRLPPAPGSSADAGVWVVECLRRSWTSLGQDSNGRWRTVQNFYATHHHPTTWRT